MRSVCDVCEAAPANLFCAADEAALCPKCDEKIDFVEYVGFCELCIEIAKSRETYPGEENLTKPYTVVGMKVHACNKLASRHVRLQLAEARAVPVCDICEKASAFFFCGIDGTSLCLQCDMDVHTGGKKAHERYLLMAQRVELPVQKPGRDDPADKQPGNNDGTHKQSGQANNGQNHVHHHHHHYHHHHHGQENKNERVITKLGANSDNSIGPAVAIAVGIDVPQSMADKQPASQMFDLNSQPQRSQIQASHPDEDEDGDRQPESSDNNHSDVVQGMTAKKG